MQPQPPLLVTGATGNTGSALLINELTRRAPFRASNSAASGVGGVQTGEHRCPPVRYLAQHGVVSRFGIEQLSLASPPVAGQLAHGSAGHGGPGLDRCPVGNRL